MDEVQALEYVEQGDSIGALSHLTDNYLFGTDEEDVVVDSAISVDNVFGERSIHKYDTLWFYCITYWHCSSIVGSITSDTKYCTYLVLFKYDADYLS